ncbi:hypothetical protein F0236_04485 [Vibrio splendidus]|uniref:hypothetical protein n=1 Tax=Vibrio splendidus TaxID=29497 RepID=UPI00148E79D3|nr:hypothetical protein [Vibrio splendidus]NOJ03003.1 hypothetical protein [Vibrio splendidus]
MKTILKLIKYTIAVAFSTVALLLISITLIDRFLHEGTIHTRDQIPESYLEKINELDLLETTEKVEYLYTDALFELEEGLYFVTNKHLVLFNQEWSPRGYIIPFESIRKVEIDYDYSYINDSIMTVRTLEHVLSFPLSSNEGRDKLFMEYLSEMIVHSPQLKSET